MQIEKTFSRELSKLIGLECWGVTCGEGSGSVLKIDIGDKITRATPLKNPHLSNIVRVNESSICFMLYSPWRLESKSEVLCGSHSPNDNTGVMVRGVNCILGQTIKSIVCKMPAFDLCIVFSNELKLVVHCSNIGIDDDECYSFKAKKGWFTVKYNGELIVEQNT